MRNLLKAGLRRFASGTSSGAQPIGDRNATVVAIAAQKGGVGKTTTSVSLAAALARFHKKRVLLIDLDPQGHVNSALHACTQPGGGLLSAVLAEEATREVREIAARTKVDGLDITPFDPTLWQTEEVMGGRIGKEFLLRDALKATRTWYDYILIDCPPNLGPLALNGLVAADQVVIPCDPSSLSLKGVESLVRTISTIAARLNPDVDVLGVLLTRVDGRNKTLNDAVMSEIEKSWGDALLPVRIGISATLPKAQHAGKDVFAYAPTGRAAAQYKKLADYLIDTLEGARARA